VFDYGSTSGTGVVCRSTDATAANIQAESGATWAESYAHLQEAVRQTVPQVGQNLAGLAILGLAAAFVFLRASAPRVEVRRNPRPRPFQQAGSRTPRGGLSYRETQTRLRKHGITLRWDTEWEEFTVRPTGSHGEKEVYHTSDLDDAWQTGIAMTRRHHKNPREVGVIPGRIEELRYIRSGRHSGPYKHAFKNPGTMHALADGSVLLKPRGKTRLWGWY
jgi:hypothetical protein